jgi:hypothetical protein
MRLMSVFTAVPRAAVDPVSVEGGGMSMLRSELPCGSLCGQVFRGLIADAQSRMFDMLHAEAFPEWFPNVSAPTAPASPPLSITAGSLEREIVARASQGRPLHIRGVQVFSRWSEGTARWHSRPGAVGVYFPHRFPGGDRGSPVHLTDDVNGRAPAPSRDSRAPGSANPRPKSIAFGVR